MPDIHAVPNPGDMPAQARLHPHLQVWLETKLENLYSATSEQDVEAALRELVAKDPRQTKIIFRGKEAILEQLKAEFANEIPEGNDIKFKVHELTGDPQEEPILEGYVRAVGRPGGHSTGRTLILEGELFLDMTLIPPRIPMSGLPGFIDRRRFRFLKIDFGEDTDREVSSGSRASE
ncbi:hypothetical protein K474DRAFT_1439653 [Panus rudis PR-1116 ss-1]|nr:hypothetical protein K474DRAFT_1439653 [Panus rudis PR-1116 ss-1]